MLVLVAWLANVGACGVAAAPKAAHCGLHKTPAFRVMKNQANCLERAEFLSVSRHEAHLSVSFLLGLPQHSTTKPCIEHHFADVTWRAIEWSWLAEESRIHTMCVYTYTAI